MKGLPCSGKTSWAKAWANESHNRVRVSWSDILETMGGGKFRRERRPLAFDAALRLMCCALRAGMDVVLDEENLHGSEWGLFVARAQQCRAKVEWHYMAVSAEECKRRNTLMGHPVADMLIDRLAERWKDWLK